VNAFSSRPDKSGNHLPTECSKMRGWWSGVGRFCIAISEGGRDVKTAWQTFHRTPCLYLAVTWQNLKSCGGPWRSSTQIWSLD